MVTLEEVQTVYYMIAATGVLVAAIFYILNLRVSQKALRMNMTNNVIQLISNVEANRNWGELLNMEWKDYEDFERKYGSDANLENFAKRMTLWSHFEVLGSMLKAGLLESEIVYNCTALAATYTWAKFRPIMDEWKKRYGGRDSYSNFEYLATEMLNKKMERDPSYRLPESLAKYVPNK